MNISMILWGIPQAMRATALIYPEFKELLKEKNLVAQFKLKDTNTGRWVQLENGTISSGKGIHENPDITVWFKS